MANYVLGQVLNKDFVTDRKIHKVAANVSLKAGYLHYQDGANGLKVVPTSSQPQASRIRYLIGADVDNTGGALGAKWGETVKHGAIVVGRADGAIVVDTYCRASVNHAGEFQALAIPADPTGGEDPTEAEHILVLEFLRRAVAIYLGHVNEGVESNKECTDAADEEENLRFLML